MNQQSYLRPSNHGGSGWKKGQNMRVLGNFKGGEAFWPGSSAGRWGVCRYVDFVWDDLSAKKRKSGREISVVGVRVGRQFQHFESHFGPVQVEMVSRSMWLATTLIGIVCISAVYGRVGVDVSTAVSVYGGSWHSLCIILFLLLLNFPLLLSPFSLRLTLPSHSLLFHP